MSSTWRRVLVVLACCSQTEAFVSPAPRATQPKAKLSFSPIDVVPVAKGLATLPTLYSLMSVNEYFTHRYYQHAEFNKSPWLQKIARFIFAPMGKEVPTIRGGGHVEHHAETLDDMTLKTDDKWRSSPAALSLDADPYRGTAFTWRVSTYMTLQMLPTALPIFMLGFGYSLATSFAVLLPAMLVHALVWNSLHPAMHALPDVPFADGAPSSLLARFRDSAYFRFLYANHQGHHIVGGRGNYNVCLPGADHLFGTYVPEREWQPKASTTYESHHGVDLSLQDQISNHIARETAKDKELVAA